MAEQDESPVSSYATWVCDEDSCWCSQYYGTMTRCGCMKCHPQHTVNNSAPVKKLRWDGSPYGG